jgi:hypothetical protein
MAALLFLLTDKTNDLPVGMQRVCQEKEKFCKERQTAMSQVNQREKNAGQLR